jgi:cysteine desulfurase / selenocysteine lyase
VITHHSITERAAPDQPPAPPDIHDIKLMLDIAPTRAAFPFLTENTYLNTAAAGLSWKGQGTVAAGFFDAAKSQGVLGASQWAAKAVATKTELAALLGVPSHRIHFVGSTTEALNIVALSLPLASGARVVLADDEFPSVVHCWWSRLQSGVELVRVPIPDESKRTEALCAAINGRVRVLAVSHVHWRTGTRVDLEQLAQRCREHDCRLIVDGVQALGAIPVEAGVADAYCASVFKWLLSGFGLGVLVVGEQLAAELVPAVRGYRNEPPERSVSYGQVNYPGIYALQASLEYLRSVGWDNVHAQVNGLARRAMAGLHAQGFEVVTPDNGHAGIVSIRHPEASRLVSELARERIFVEDRDSIIRASPHFYNTDEEIDRFISALARLA